jgi:hypothetical protein
MTDENEDDPHDDSTHWAGQIHKESTDSNERDTERDTRRTEQPNVQRTKSSMAKRKKT